MSGPEDRRVSHFKPGHGVHAGNLHAVTKVEVRDLSVFWAGHAQLAYATQLSHATLHATLLAFERN